MKTKDALDVDRIKSAVNAALAAKGWTQVGSGGDVSIVAMEITREQQTLNTFYDGFGGRRGWRRFGGGGFGEATTTTDMCWLSLKWRSSALRQWLIRAHRGAVSVNR